LVSAFFSTLLPRRRRRAVSYTWVLQYSDARISFCCPPYHVLVPSASSAWYRVDGFSWRWNNRGRVCIARCERSKAGAAAPGLLLCLRTLPAFGFGRCCLCHTWCGTFAPRRQARVLACYAATTHAPPQRRAFTPFSFPFAACSGAPGRVPYTRFASPSAAALSLCLPGRYCVRRLTHLILVYALDGWMRRSDSCDLSERYSDVDGHLRCI